jgi:hypothetical protein
MRYRLRTLLIVLAVAPRAAASCFALVLDPLPVPYTELIIFAGVAAIATASAVVNAATE